MEVEAKPDWPAIEKDFRAHGFLAESMPLIRDHFRGKFAASLGLARELNRCAQRLYTDQSALLQGRDTMEPMALGLQLMPRVLSAFQAAIMLVEMGMPIEAKALARQVFETAFWIGYFHACPSDAVEHFRRDSVEGEIGLYKSLLTSQDLGPEIRSEAERQLSELTAVRNASGKAPAAQQMAEAAGYGGYYAHYRHLSGGATHASLKSIYGFLSRDDDGGFRGHQIGPDEDGIPEALHFSVMAWIISIDALARLTAYDDPQGFKEIQILFDRFAQADPYLHERSE